MAVVRNTLERKKKENKNFTVSIDLNRVLRMRRTYSAVAVAVGSLLFGSHESNKVVHPNRFLARPMPPSICGYYIIISRTVCSVLGSVNSCSVIDNFQWYILRNLNAPSTPRGCREVLGVLNGVYSSPLARARLPLQPRLILAVALAMSTNKKVGEVHFVT